jgi:ADP-glucose pyrophosphorylase
MEHSQPELGEYIVSVPPQQRISEEWYRGTADAVYQNLFLLDNDHPSSCSCWPATTSTR